MNRRKFFGVIGSAAVLISLPAIYFALQGLPREDASGDRLIVRNGEDIPVFSDEPAAVIVIESGDDIHGYTDEPVSEAPTVEPDPGTDHRPETPQAQQQPAARATSVLPAPDPLRPPRQHVWEVLLENHSEACGYALYTYVIFTRRIAEQELLQESTLARYRALLGAITTSTPQSDEAPSFAPRMTNIFYIPAKHKPVSGVLQLEDYDGHVAMRFISDLHTRLRHDRGRDLKERIASDPGPFLISTLEPHSADCPATRQPAAASAPPNILFVDLSSEHPSAMREVVSVYKAYTQEALVTGIERFSSLKIALLSVLLHVDDSITMVEMAAAEIIPD